MLLDCAVLALIGGAILALRRIRPPKPMDAQGAFQDLDSAITRFVPNMPPGFTWGEAVERLKGAGVDIDWSKMESSLSEYEAFRYGGREMPKGDEDVVVRLSMKIRRKVVGYRSKRESTRPD